MEDRVFIQWTVVNWITIFLMAVLGFLLVGAVAQAGHNMSAKKSTDNSNG